MDVVNPDDLPFGFVRVDSSGEVVDSNNFFRMWAENESPAGHPLSDFLVPVEDFLDTGRQLEMMARPDRPNRAAFLIAASDGVTFTVIDASERYAAGLALRHAHALSDRTQRRLQLVIDASIAFAQATTEARLAEILAGTAALAYRAEESAVYLSDSGGALSLAFGTNPFASYTSAREPSFDVLGVDRVLKISSQEEASLISEELPAEMAATGVRAIIAAPLHLDHQNFGAFACFFRHPRQFDDEAAPLAGALAGQAAGALATIRLEHAAMHDETTGLPNRRHLEKQASGYADDLRVGVIFIDLDGFKAVNDRLGHPRGDQVLREVARRLQASVRDADLVARYGGDEFVVVCDVSEAGANVMAEIAERVREALQDPYPGLPADITLSASIGVAAGSVGLGSSSVDRLIRTADQAMYAAKLSGGNLVEGL